MPEEDVMEGVKETIETLKKDFERVETYLQFLEAMDIDTKDIRKDYDDIKEKIAKMERAYSVTTGRL